MESDNECKYSNRNTGAVVLVAIIKYPRKRDHAVFARRVFVVCRKLHWIFGVQVA